MLQHICLQFELWDVKNFLWIPIHTTARICIPDFWDRTFCTLV